MFIKIISASGGTLRDVLHSSSLLGAYNSVYKTTAFGFRPNPRFTRTSHIDGMSYEIPNPHFKLKRMNIIMLCTNNKAKGVKQNG